MVLFCSRLGHFIVAMVRYPRESAEALVGQMRQMSWWRREIRFAWMASSSPQLAYRVAALMAPDELLQGTLTGIKATGDVIALPDLALPDLASPTRQTRQLSIGEAFERSVRARR